MLDEWVIREIKESLEALMPKVRASEEEIKDLSVLDSKAMHFSLISPTRMTAWVDENM